MNEEEAIPESPTPLLTILMEEMDRLRRLNTRLEERYVTRQEDEFAQEIIRDVRENTATIIQLLINLWERGER